MSANIESPSEPVFVAAKGTGRRAAAGRALQAKAADALRWARRQALPWTLTQLREMRREIQRAARPPVKVRTHGRNVLAISTRPEFGGGLLLVPLNGSGIVGASWSRPNNSRSDAEVRFGVDVWADTPNGREIWPVGEFPDKETAEQACDLIRKPLTGSTWGKWVVRVLVLWFLVILLRAWFAQPAVASGAVAAAPGAGATAAAVDPSAAALMGLFGNGGGESAGNVPPALAAALAGDGATPASGSLADEIYNEAMAKAKVSMHEQGPPQSPAPDTGLKGFGLSGGQTGAGCDPKLAFKVSP